VGKGNLIFVKTFQVIRAFLSQPNFSYYDPVENPFVKKLVMLQAYLTCVKQINKKDKMVKFDKKYSDLFKKNKN